MPTYTYICENCTEEIDIIVKLKDLEDHIETCPTCKGEMFRRIGNLGGFRLKGSGWASSGYSDCIGDDPRYSIDTGYNGRRTDEI